MASEEDDPIIQEIDVHLAKSLAEKLYLFQYPVRPATMKYDDVTHLSARIKPKQQKVEVEMAIDTVSPNYCRSKGEQIALNVDGTCTDDSGSTYATKLMDKQIFSSIQSAVNTSRYAAAVYRKGELHVTPLHGILQLRPSFSYLDKADAKHREREAANEAGDSSQDEAEDDVKQITVRFSRPESEQARQRRIQSYEFLQKKQAEEPWHHLHYCGVKDSRSEHERQYLFSQLAGMVETTELTKSPSEYLSMLMPPVEEEESKVPLAPSNVLSMAQLRTLPLADQVRTLMKNVKVVQFANLMGLLGSGVDSTAVLRCIQQVAMLVQGCWVVKSDVLYPKDSCSPHSGVAAEVLCRGRDFAMWKFTQDLWVVRKEIAAVIKLPPEDVKDFLEQMAVPRVNKGWEFLLPPDAEFVKKHPDVVQRQHMLWMGIQAKLEKVYNLSKEDMMPKKPTSQAAASSAAVCGERRVAVAKERARENHAILENNYRRRKAPHSTGIQAPQGTPLTIKIKEEPLSEEEPMDTSSRLESEAANGVHSDESSRDSADLPAECQGARSEVVTAELKEFVRGTLRKHYVLSLSELKRLFNLHLASLPPGHILFSGISDRMLQETLLDCGCKQILVPFPPQTTASPDEQKVFALWEAGDSFDQHRQILLEIFSKNYRVRRNVIQSKLGQDFGESLSKPDVDKVLKDCCASHGGMWYLKGTLPS
ncbi:DNA-directed RNA polymerase III subunit RPC5 isoform X1 [Carcharodon carcharias]|uniref:DNA-directed RNA polymerase III subunit RPC5 isoform X1 n=1 Tax=Carcharodon carcharias TaxID=13397 RepID=UPI001B7EF58F|nr:DNA-directed RNA polymerase III subunit RPC5 isoform X1 [Carcharodon carcharias]